MKYFFTFFISICFFSLCAGEKTRIDSILASVNGEPISLLDVLFVSFNDEKILGSVYKGEELKAEIKKLRKKALNEIINFKLIYEDFKNKNKHFIASQDIQNEVGRIAARLSDGSIAGLEKDALKYGFTLKELREKAKERIAVEIMKVNYCYRDVSFTPREIYNYYKENLDKHGKKAMISLQIILLRKNGKNSQRLNDLTKEIKDSLKNKNVAIFKSMARLYSEGPNPQNGGDIGWVETKKLRPEFAKALSGKVEGDIEGPVNTDDGVCFLRINKIQETQVAPFKSVKDKIKRELEDKERGKKYREYLDKLKKDAIIRIYI